MKKRIMLSIGVLAIAVVVSLNLNLAKTDSNSLAFMNIQALAGETGGGGGESGDLSKGCKTEFENIYTNDKSVHKKWCVQGKAKTCKNAHITKINKVSQPGSYTTAYVCK